MKLKNGYILHVIKYGEQSPMEDHLGGEIAADDENHAFFVHEVTVVTNGLNSIINACEKYPIRNQP